LDLLHRLQLPSIQTSSRCLMSVGVSKFFLHVNQPENRP